MWNIRHLCGNCCKSRFMMFIERKFQKIKLQNQGKVENIFLMFPKNLFWEQLKTLRKGTAQLSAQCSLPWVIWKCSFEWTVFQFLQSFLNYKYPLYMWNTRHLCGNCCKSWFSDVRWEQISENKIAKSGESREHLFDVSEKLVLGTTENTEKRHCSLECTVQFTMGHMKMFTWVNSLPIPSVLSNSIFLLVPLILESVFYQKIANVTKVLKCVETVCLVDWFANFNFIFPLSMNQLLCNPVNLPLGESNIKIKNYSKHVLCFWFSEHCFTIFLIQMYFD